MGSAQTAWRVIISASVCLMGCLELPTDAGPPESEPVPDSTVGPPKPQPRPDGAIAPRDSGPKTDTAPSVDIGSTDGALLEDATPSRDAVSVCERSEETCDGLDNDCDGRTDEQPGACDCNPVRNAPFLLCNRAVSWGVARAACEARGTHLAVVTTSTHNRRLLEALENQQDSESDIIRIWMGLHDIDPSEGEHTFVWVNDDPSQYRDWADFQPDNHNDEEDCGEFILRPKTNRDALLFGWNDRSCDTNTIMHGMRKQCIHIYIT